MPKMTARGVAKLTAPGRYPDSDTPTLFLLVKPTGARSWVQRLVVHGVRRDMGLGGLEWRSLAEARELARANRRVARQGGDPRRARTMTFREAAAKALAANKARWRNAKTAAAWTTSMDRYAGAIMDRPVDQVGREDVLAILSPIWTTKPEEARKLRTRIKATLSWCQAHNLIADNPAGEAIGAALPSTKATMTRHFRALPYADVSAALAVIDQSGASLPVKACLRFVVLTSVRSGEARLARWAEVDLPGRVWVIPAARTKMNRVHKVPLSDQAVETLQAVRPLRRDADLVFPSPQKAGAPLSDMSLTKLLRDAGLADRATVHGFRSSFRDWCAEKAPDVPHAVCEQSLGHQSGSAVEKAYLRSDLFDQRRDLMDRWACYLAS